MLSKRNVFLVLTEYQLLQAINISTCVFNKSSENNIIYVVRNGRRMMTIDSEKNWVFENLQIIILDNNGQDEIAEKVLNKKPDRFIFFQAGSPLNIYLAHTLSKKGAEISLGPDGYGCYAVYNKRFHLLSVLVDSFKNNYYLIKNKQFSGKLHRFDFYTYGNHNFIDNLWITHPQKYKHLAKNTVKIIPLPQFADTSINLISKLFNFTGSFPLQDAIFFFNQPIDSVLVKREFEFLKEVLATFPQRKLILKLHPMTSEESKLKYRSLSAIQIIESNVPAEVLLLRLKNCIVFTGWSAALITENKTCNYYFNYPIFKELNHLIVRQSELVKLDHIKMISSALEMEFPNE